MALSLARFVSLAFAAIVSVRLEQAQARVVGFDLISRTDVLDGRAFGSVGNYEKIVGKLHFADLPGTDSNRRIVDLERGPHNSRGEVESTADVYLLRPKVAERGNGVAIVEINNRGGKALIWHANQATPANDPTTEADFGDGFLMRAGYTVAWVGWQFDVPREPSTMRLDVPVATDGNAPLRGLVRSDFHVDAPVPDHEIGHNGHTPYPITDEHDAANVLTERDGIVAPRRRIARDTWHFSTGGTKVVRDGGFVPGKVYELVYRAKDPVPVGLGFAAERDAVAWLKHDPSAPAHVRRAYGYGVSQSGRFLRQFLYEGFNADEEQRPVFDGVMALVTGAGLGSFNYRFAQPSRDAAAFSSFFYPTDRFPFTDAEERDPVTGAHDGILAAESARGSAVKVMYLFTSHEYYGRVASLMTTDVTGTRDVTLPPNVRAYAYDGGEHVPRVAPLLRAPYRYRVDPLDYTWSERGCSNASTRGCIRGVTAPEPLSANR